MSPDHCSRSASVAGLELNSFAAHSAVAAFPLPPPRPAPALLLIFMLQARAPSDREAQKLGGQRLDLKTITPFHLRCRSKAEEWAWLHQAQVEGASGESDDLWGLACQA
jgi:hypothetical protein